jgi:hypothetical protein
MKAAQLKRKTREQLIALAKAAGIPARRRATKAELVKAIISKVPGRRPDSSERTELPLEYGRTRLVLMEVEPRLIHVYWEVTPEDFKSAMSRVRPAGESSPWILRFYDITYIHFDGTNAHAHFDVPVDLAPHSWYVHLWEGEKTYIAEIGPRVPAGGLIPVCRSNAVHVPRSSPSLRYDPQWLRVDFASGRTELVEEPVSEVAAPVGVMDIRTMGASAREGELFRSSVRSVGKPEPQPPCVEQQEIPLPEAVTEGNSREEVPAGNFHTEAVPDAWPSADRPPQVSSSEGAGSFGLGAAPFANQAAVTAERVLSVEPPVAGRWVRSEESDVFVLQPFTRDV